MPDEPLPTKFLPAEKETMEVIREQNRVIKAIPLLCELLDSMLNLSFMLNSKRQIVFANAMALKTFQYDAESILGLRGGELFTCSHACEGCGTTDFCKECGAAKAIASALNGTREVTECNVVPVKAGDELNLLVCATPFRYGKESFILFSAIDASENKRKQVLERIFFHDIINTAGGLKGIISLIADTPQEADKFIPFAENASDRLMDQILSQKDLSAAERGELTLAPAEIDALKFLENLAALFRNHEVAKDKEIALDASCASFTFRSDPTLLTRTVGNALKNALEAEGRGARITLSCGRTQDSVRLSIHNPTPMPEKTRLQIFQRSFSTKGAGRGLGTYSMRLLTEKYLGGKVSLDVNEKGTTFTVSLPS